MFKSLVPSLFGGSQERQVPVTRGNLAPFEQLQHDINRIFDDFFTGSSLLPFNEFKHQFSPQVDINETDEAYQVSAELPGLTDKDIEVNLTQNTLTISGEKRSEREEKQDNYHYSERSYGSFKRVIPLNAEVEADNVSAVFKNGVLTITVPKTDVEQTSRKKITINTD